MKERPILFNGEMVRAVLDLLKTNTRRVIKRELPDDFADWSEEAKREALYWKCPYGVPGDRLWVRETHAICQAVGHVRRQRGSASYEFSDGFAEYKADGHETIDDLKSHIKLMGESVDEVFVKDDRWRPSIHMPRWASRITLEVTDVRVERVKEISPAACISEGIKWQMGPDSTKLAFMELWDSINAKRGYGWKTNPWVWVVEFKKIDPVYFDDILEPDA